MRVGKEEGMSRQHGTAGRRWFGHLPPSPLSEPHAASSSDTALPWPVAHATAIAGLIGGSVAVAPAVLGSQPPAWRVLAAWLGTSVAYGALLGASAAAVDRMLPRWARASRWPLGMGVGGSMPQATVVLLLSAGSMQVDARTAAVEAVFAGLIAACVGHVAGHLAATPHLTGCVLVLELFAVGAVTVLGASATQISAWARVASALPLSGA